MIELKNITKIYKAKKTSETIALKNINLKLQDKGMVFILGKSGSGKSTLLNLLGGLDKYTTGDLIVNGKSTKNFKNRDWDNYRNTYIGFVFQDYNLLFNKTVEENIKFPLELQDREIDEKNITDILSMVQLSGYEKRNINELSGGEQQRVAIARALIKSPDLILADEPTGNLDSANSNIICDILKGLSKERLVVIVSHDEELSNRYADRIIRIKDGELISDTNNDNITNLKEFSLRRNKLPLKYNFKMGISNLLHKKFKTILTIIIMIFAFSFFSISFSFWHIDFNNEYEKNFIENNNFPVNVSEYTDYIDYKKDILKFGINKLLDNEDGQENHVHDKELTDSFKESVLQKTGLKFFYTYVYNDNEHNIKYENDDSSKYPFYYSKKRYFFLNLSNNKIHNGNIYFVDISSSNIDKLSIIGRKPLEKNEIIITSFVADQIIYNGILSKNSDNDTSEKLYKPINYDQIVNDNNYIKFGKEYFKITGILDYNEQINNRYKKLKEVSFDNLLDKYTYDKEKNNLFNLFNEFDSLSELYNRVYVTDEYINDALNKESNFGNVYISNFDINIKPNIYKFDKEFNILTNEGIKNIKKLNDNEIIINLTLLNKLSQGELYNQMLSESKSNKFVNKNYFIISYLKKNNIDLNVDLSFFDYAISDWTDTKNYRIVGIVLDNSEEEAIYMNEVKERYKSPYFIKKSLTYDINTIKELKAVLRYYPITKSNTLSDSYISNEIISSYEATIEYRIIFLILAVIFSIFTIILLLNISLNSISLRKKEIGVLRSLGVRKYDIILQFLYEFGFISIICFIITIIISKCLTNWLSETFSTLLFLKPSFTLYNVISLVIFIIFVVVLSTFVPIYRLVKKDAIDIIKKK